MSGRLLRLALILGILATMMLTAAVAADEAQVDPAMVALRERTDRAVAGTPSDVLNGAYKYFEHGQMLWISVQDPCSGSQINSVLVLFNDGTYTSYQDTWAEGQPVDDPSIVSPAGLHQPVRGFGKIWREAPGVRDRLGWATEPEAGTSGRLLAFEFAGYMAQIDALEQIYVFFGYFGWMDSGEWQVFDDPFVDEGRGPRAEG